MDYFSVVGRIPAADRILLQVAVSSVLPEERLLIRSVEEYPGIYHAIARYGYTDTIDHGADFLSKILDQVWLNLSTMPPSLEPYANKAINPAAEAPPPLPGGIPPLISPQPPASPQRASKPLSNLQVKRVHDHGDLSHPSMLYVTVDAKLKCKPSSSILKRFFVGG